MKQTKVYQNGNPVAYGAESDHVKVRAILATGIVPRVDNFGPLLMDKTIGPVKQVITSGNYELHIVPMDNVTGFIIGACAPALTQAKNVNWVYYQRISQ